MDVTLPHFLIKIYCQQFSAVLIVKQSGTSRHVIEVIRVVQVSVILCI